MQELKEGTPIPLEKYAEKMISISDNTATDHLLHLVSKESVEEFISREQLNHFPDQNVPFLSTLDIFKLKAFISRKQAENYLKLNRVQKENLITKFPYTTRNDLLKRLSNWTSPRYIDQIEWFATPQDICQLYQWLDDRNDKKIRHILSINTPFINVQKSKKWAYAGYKGGSEPGVLEMAYLLEDKQGQKHCLYIGHNNSEKPINQEDFFALVKGLFKFLENNP